MNYYDNLLRDNSRDVMGYEDDNYCAACGAFGAEYCFYEGRPLCKDCSRVWDELGTKEADDEPRTSSL